MRNIAMFSLTILLASSCGSNQYKSDNEVQKNNSVSSGELTAQHSWCETRAQGRQINTWYSESVTSKPEFVDRLNIARTQWNNVGANVTVVRVSAKNSTSGTETDNYWIGAGERGLWGEVVPFIRNGTTVYEVPATSENLNARWAKADVKLYPDQMTADGMTDTNRLATTIHEVGHSLKLAHPTDPSQSGACASTTPVPAGKETVMRQDFKDFGVQEYDRNELIKKWGAR